MRRLCIYHMIILLLIQWTMPLDEMFNILSPQESIQIIQIVFYLYQSYKIENITH
jgi:hypothetical protein